MIRANSVRANSLNMSDGGTVRTVQQVNFRKSALSSSIESDTVALACYFNQFDLNLLHNARKKWILIAHSCLSRYRRMNRCSDSITRNKRLGSARRGEKRNNKGADSTICTHSANGKSKQSKSSLFHVFTVSKLEPFNVMSSRCEKAFCLLPFALSQVDAKGSDAELLRFGGILFSGWWQIVIRNAITCVTF